ncbi:hypothetical protein [Inquilinus limosus]|uniref:hypothetical protein n=1 Tax=Inquilinus limosus TaxID=171674 RepID=UPI0004111130|nr:hypothetical protein [Inquilinus limosus]
MAQLIGRLAAQSETFRSLCEDHQLAVETLERLVARCPTNDKIIDEYHTLVKELEADIETVLQKIRS